MKGYLTCSKQSKILSYLRSNQLVQLFIYSETEETKYMDNVLSNNFIFICFYNTDNNTRGITKRYFPLNFEKVYGTFVEPCTSVQP